MTSVASVAGTAANTQSKALNDSLGATEDRFLKLLVAQMRNQDPLNPLDNAQVTSQMAQLSTVSGINKLADLMQSLTSSFGQTQSLQAAGMIGRSVLTEGSSIVLKGGTAMGGFELASPADQVVVQVKDAAGNLIHSTNLGAQSAGVTVFQWDGVADNGSAVPDGNYRFEVRALQNGQPVQATRLSYGTVASVSFAGGADVQLNLLNLGAVGLSQIKQIM
jgi:flagellar basal-body rod modification protein FlgD